MTGWSTVAFINLEINAITLSTPEMAESVRFWTVPGLEVTYGGPQDPFTTLALGANYINLFTVNLRSLSLSSRGQRSGVGLSCTCHRQMICGSVT